MRWLFFRLLLLAATAFLPAPAQDNAQDNVVQEFSGVGSTTTGLFKVQDRWEVRWNARQVVSVAVMSADGTIVAGAAGVLRGSLFVPLGGQYYFKISDGTIAPPAATNATPPPNTNSPPPATTNAAPAASANAPPVATTNTPSATPPPVEAESSSPPPPEPVVSWHLQVVQLGTTIASTQALTVYTPYFMLPDSAVTPVAVPPPPPPPELTDDQTHTVVTIKGDNAQGAGFLLRSPDGTFVVTSLHLLAANPNVKLFTDSGAPITAVSLKGATDRDMAFFTIQDDHYTYLPLPTDAANSFDAGDQLIIPDIGQQAEVLQGVPGKVIGARPGRLDFDNGISPGCSGAPVIHVKSGNVLALVTAEKQVDLSDNIAKAWPSNPAPGSSGIIPYFGVRLTDVQGWETYDPDRFLAETLFLKQFHQDTRCLDSYLNGRRRRPRNDDDAGPPDNQYFLKNLKIREANETYKQLANDADRNQRLDAATELLFDLQGVADTGMSTLQGMSNLYAYDQAWAQEEIAYRKALKKELDDLSNNINRLDNMARSH